MLIVPGRSSGSGNRALVAFALSVSVAVVAGPGAAGCGSGAISPGVAGAGGRGGAAGQGGPGGGGGLGGAGPSLGVGGALPICQDATASACALGAQRCEGSAIQTCVTGSDGCGVWSLVELCGAPLVCERYEGPTCQDVDWAEWPVPNAPGDEDSPNPQSYTDNGDGTVTDNVTKLMWQQRAEAQMFTLPQAVLACWAASTGGHHDWRLPSLIELLSLVDYSVAMPGPTINPVFSSADPTARFFWSATAIASSSEYVAGVSFDDGNFGSEDFRKTSYARCVR